MGLTVTTDRDGVGALARRFLALDPVRGTTLGTIAEMVDDGAWAATQGTGLAIRSAVGHPLLLLGDWPAPARAGLARVLPPVTALSGPAEVVRAVLDLLGRVVTETTGEGLFRCDEVRPPAGVGGTARRAGVEHHRLLVEWVQAFMAEAHAGFGLPEDFVRRVGSGCWLWFDGPNRPVSLAARRTAHGGSARIGPVYTPPQLRGYGYGSAVTAAATRDVLDEGAVPVLFTDLANPTSNKIYQAIGYRPVEQRLLVRLARG